MLYDVTGGSAGRGSSQSRSMPPRHVVELRFAGCAGAGIGVGVAVAVAVFVGVGVFVAVGVGVAVFVAVGVAVGVAVFVGVGVGHVTLADGVADTMLLLVDSTPLTREKAVNWYVVPLVRPVITALEPLIVPEESG